MNVRQIVRNFLVDLVRLGRVVAVDDSTPFQNVNVNVRVGTFDTKVARIQNYGFSGVPDASGKLLGVEITCNGNRFLVALDDLARPTGNEPGEVMVWHKNGDFIHLKNGNAIEVQTHDYIVNCNTMYLNGDLVHNGDATIVGDTEQTGSITASVDVSAGGKSGKNHTHNHAHSHPSGSTTPLETDGPNP